MNILFVVNVDWFFVSHRLPIAIEAKRRGHEVHIATAITTHLELLKRHGFHVHALAIDRSDTRLRSMFQNLFQILGVMRQVRPDIVHLVTIKPVLLGGIAARLAGVPAIVAAVSGLGFVFVSHGWKAAVRRAAVVALYRLALAHPNLKVIFQNQGDRQKLAKVANLATADMALIRGSGVDLAEYALTPLPSGAPIVLLAARLLLEKGVREFADAAKRLRGQAGGRFAAVRFVFVGEPDPHNPSSLPAHELRQWVAEGLVESWGRRSDMPQVIAAAHLVVLPSYYGEGLPKILVEAAACGRAVVTTDHPGCRDAIEPDQSGLLVPIRDGEALARAIEGLLLDTEKCRAMGQAGRRLAERAFSIERIVEQHLDIYAELSARVNR